MIKREEQQKGVLYQTNNPEILKDLYYCENEYFEINQIPPSCGEERTKRLKSLFGKAGKGVFTVAPFFCDYGYNIEAGEGFFVSTNCVILDEAKTALGDNVFVAPNCAFYTAGHPLDVEQRDKRIEYALPIHVENSVWIGGSIVAMPGVTVGDNTTTGAGSVVTHDIPNDVVAADNPYGAIRKLEE